MTTPKEVSIVAHLALALLGPFQATLDGQPITALTAGRLQALLSYLAVEAEREHSREALAGLLWPERSDQEALQALRYALSNLRRAIRDATAQPPYLLITRHTIQFNRASDYWLDVDDFTLASHEPAAALATIKQLTAAIALYRGKFLSGLTLGDSVAFEEWMLLKGEQFHRQALTFLQQLATLHKQDGSYKPAVACARRYLTLEPWDEAAHRHLMYLLALDGQRSAALAQYETCCRVLSSELKVEPEDNTVRLYENIRDGTLAPSKREKASPAVTKPAPLFPYPSPATSLFVGREAELTQLNQHLALALAHQGKVIFISGEAGSGKTALLSEFARQAMATHTDLLSAAGRAAAQAGTGDPYLPFREILGLLTGDFEGGRACPINSTSQMQRVSTALPAVVEALIELGPGLLDIWVPGKPLLQRIESLSLDEAPWKQRLEALLASRRNRVRPPAQSEHLFEQVSRVLQAVAKQQPLLLVLDDLQWADPGSLSLLFHLGRKLDNRRILIACAYRPADLIVEDQRHPLLSIIHEFQREWGKIVIDLDQAEGRSFVNAYLDSEPNRLDEEFRDRFYHVVGGNPLFTVELVHRLQEQGYLTRDTAGCWVAGSTLDWQKMPGRVEAIIAERLSRLPGEWRAVLNVASVMGEAFEAELVARVLGVNEGAVLRTLGSLLSKQQQLVRAVGLSQLPNGQRLSRYRFRHGLFQRYLYQELDEAERANLHEAIGSQLETLYPEPLSDLAPWLAWHFEAAGILDKAADYYLAAGNQAYRLSAHEESIVHYRKGLAMLKRLPQTADPSLRQARMQRELALHLGLGHPLGVTRGWASPEQTHAYEQAYELARKLAGQGEIAPEFLLSFSSYVETMAAQGELQQALTLSKRLLALATQQQENPLALELAYWVLGTTYLFQSDYVLGRKYLEAAITLYRSQPKRLPDLTATDVGVNCLSWLSFALCALGYPEQGLSRSREAIARAWEVDMPLSQGIALAVAGCSTHICCRQRQAVEEYAAELLSLAQAKDLQVFHEWVEIALGWCQVEEGKFEAGITQMLQGTRAWQQMGTIIGHFWHLSLIAEAHSKAGQVDEGLACIEEGLDLLQRIGYSQYEPELHRVHGELLMLRSADEAEWHFQHAIDIARWQRTRWWELRATMSLARLWQTRGSIHRQRAREMLSGLVSWFNEGFNLPDLQEAQALIRDLAPEKGEH